MIPDAAEVRGHDDLPFSPIVRHALADQPYVGGLNSLKPASSVKAHRHARSRLHELHDAPAQAIQARGSETMQHHMISLVKMEPIRLATHRVTP